MARHPVNMDAIKKLDINIVLPPDIPQSSAMEWANECYERSFRQAIEKAVSSFDDSVEAVIPNIRIDLGEIEESEIPFRLERKLRDEIARHIRPSGMTGEINDAGDDSFSGESPADAYALDRVRSTSERSPGDKRGTTGSAALERQRDDVHLRSADNAYGKRAERDVLLVDDKSDVLSEDVVRENIARTVEEELLLAYLRYVVEGYSDLEVLGKQYSFQEIATMIEAILVSSKHPDKKEQMTTRLRLALEKSFPLSFFRMEHTLPLPVLFRIILSQSDPVFREVARMIEVMIEERADSASVSLALFAVSSFRVLYRTDKDGAQQRIEGRIETHAGKSLSKRSMEELTSFIQKLSEATAEAGWMSIQSAGITAPSSSAVDSIFSAEVIEGLFSNLPDHAVYRTLIDDLPKESGLSDVLSGIKRIASASVLKKGSEPEEQETAHRLFTEDAGLVLLHPFFRPLFNRLSLLDEHGKFLTLDHQVRAVHLLKCLVDGFDETQDDNDLLFCKLLCGLPYEFLIDDEFRIQEQEKREICELYGAVLQYWNPFKSSSHESMRQAFVKRKGSVEMIEKGYVVRVSGNSIDILMDELPWEISMFFLPWTSPFMVEWQKEQ